MSEGLEQTFNGVDSSEAHEGDVWMRLAEMVGKIGGLGSIVRSFGELAVKNNYISKETAKKLEEFPLMKAAQIMLIPLHLLTAEPPDMEKFGKAVGGRVQAEEIYRRDRSIEIMQQQNSLTPQEQMTSFFREVSIPAKSLHDRFANTGDAVKDMALRFVLGNIFISYKNRIEAMGLEEMPGYQTLLEETLGVSIDLSDLFKEMADPEKGKRITAEILEVYSTYDCQLLQQIVGDSRALFYYEVLNGANQDRGNVEAYKKKWQPQINEAIECFYPDFVAKYKREKHEEKNLFAKNPEPMPEEIQKPENNRSLETAVKYVSKEVKVSEAPSDKRVPLDDLDEFFKAPSEKKVLPPELDQLFKK